jgi:gamma-butyrobetaine dioxygenase/trimethyllysine dioxygenase
MARGSSVSPASQRFTISGADSVSGGVEVHWADGHVSRFPFIWLRHNCECPECGSTETARRFLRMTDIPASIASQSVEVDPQGDLAVAWQPSGHRSVFGPRWLRSHCLSRSERDRRRFEPVTWHPKTQSVLRYFAFSSLADPAERLAFLERLRDYGFAILTEVTCDREATERVALTIGTLRATNYGIYELISRPTPQLVGDSSVPLDPHTDEPYRHNPPGITFFHVLAQSDAGGDSTLVDACYLAEQLRVEDPDAFRLLSTIPVGFHRVLKEGRAFHAAGPILGLDRDGRFEGVRLLDRGMAPLDADEELVMPFYAALRTWLTRLYDPLNQLCVKIQPGEMLIFNNQRLLHGRTGFDPTTSHRHVRSCNVDLDEFYSSLRVAYRELGREESFMRLPQGPGR